MWREVTSAMAGVKREGELSSSAASTKPRNEIWVFSPALHPPTRRVPGTRVFTLTPSLPLPKSA